MDTIDLYDESGNREAFHILDTFGVDDSDYVALMPVNELNSLTYILRMEYSFNGEIMLSTIDDDEEFNEVIATYDEIVKNRLQ